mgnify:CR=1 FL=1
MNRQKSFENNQPTLYLVATPIGNLDEMTYRSINILNEVNYIAAEDTRNTVKLLNHFNISTKLISHHEHNIKQSIPKLISLLEEGNDIALVSDAGYPAISDPGYELVKEAISKDINVVPISGCNACLDALVVSGIAPQPFLFYGFLDHLDKKKKKELQDLKKYKDRITAAQKETGEKDALITMTGTLYNMPVVVAASNFSFMGGSMGSVVGSKFVKAAEKAMELNCPFVCFSASGGARMQEALFSLMQMAKTSAVLAKMREKGVPFISVLTDPTLGGVSASFAMLGDVNIAEPKALIGFAGPRVIEQTVREKLPEGFQRSEFLLEKGAIDMIVKRSEMRSTLGNLLSKLTNQPSPFVEVEVVENA